MISFTDLFLGWLEERGSYRMIKRDGKPYLKRYIIARFPGKRAIYLHQFWASDPDHVHDHPWANASLILKGGYREHYHDGTYIDRTPGSWTVRDATTLHRIEVPAGTEGSAWSLFFTGRRVRQWGFLTEEGWQSAREYDRQPVEVYGRDFIYKGWIFPRVVKVTQ